MPQEMGLPKYYNFKETEPGTLLVDKGEYVGDCMGKFGPQYRFRQIEDGQIVVLSGGQIKWRVEQGHIVEGDVLDITYEGKEILESGNYKGKETNNFKFAKYTRSELQEMGFEPTVAVIASQASQVAQSAEPLDDLE